MKVPLLDLRAQYSRIKEEIQSALDRVIESQLFILGPEVEALESEVAAYSGTKYAVGVSSGTDGLLVALMALDIKPGDEVITTPFTFFATAGVIVRLRATPIFVDIDPVTFNMNPDLIEDAVSSRTKAIIPVHLFGQCVDMNPIMEIARRRGIHVIEDSCQSIGAEYKGRKSGTIADVGVFSFFPSKNLGGFGDGGMVVTRDRALFQKIRLLRQHGSDKTYDHRFVGGNFRLDAIQAAVLRIKMKYLDDWSASRRSNAAYYSRRFKEEDSRIGMLVRTPIPVYENRGDIGFHVYNQYTLRAKERDKLQAFLNENGIGTGIYYPKPLHFQACFTDLGYKKGDFVEAERAASEALSIPIYPELSGEQKEYVVQEILKFYR